MRDELFQLGERRALLFQSFACFVRHEAERRGLRHLFFMTREGVFFSEVHKRLFAHVDTGSTSIDTQLIEASRQSTFGPAVAIDGRIELDRLWHLYPTITPSAFLRSLNLTAEQFAPYFRWQGLTIDQQIDCPWRDPQFLKVTTDSEFVADALKSLYRQRKLALEYLTHLFADRTRIGIVEIGWQGSIQDNLALLFPNKEFLGFYLGLAIAKNPPLPNSRKFAFGPDRNRSTSHRRLLDAVNVLEFLCLSLGGSVTLYTRDGNQDIYAVRSPCPAEEVLIEKCSIPFQQGVMQTATSKRAHELMTVLKNGQLREPALREWQRILQRPDSELVRAYFLLKSNEEFGLGEFRDQSATPSWKMIWSSPFSASARKGLIRYLTYSQWAEGLRHRKDISRPKRWVLYGLMRGALIVKSLIHGQKVRHAV